MALVHTSRIKEDMILSEDVKDVRGRLLLPKGQKLRSKHIDVMKKWGVTEVHVTDASVSEQGSDPHSEQPDLEQVEEQTRPVFTFVDLDHPAIKELFRLSVLFRHAHGITRAKAPSFSSEALDKDNLRIADIRENLNQQEVKLPEIPEIVFELNDILSDPLSTADNLAQVVAKSPSLTAALLRIVNSSFYGLSSRIDTISRAVTIIGTREISSLALVICTLSVFKNIPREILDMRSFLKHSFACGLIARMLAANKDISETEQLFVAGLLHDIGRVIIYKYFPEQAKALLMRCMEQEKILHREEITLLGCTHTDISRYLLGKWNFPPVLEENIFFHHNPMSAGDPLKASIIHLADIMANGLGMGTSGEYFVPPMDNEAWDLLDLRPSTFEMIINQANHQISALDLFLQE